MKAMKTLPSPFRWMVQNDTRNLLAEAEREEREKEIYLLFSSTESVIEIKTCKHAYYLFIKIIIIIYSDVIVHC